MNLNIYEFDELCKRNWDVFVSHIFRECNKVADLLAHHGHSLGFGIHVNSIYPPEVDRVIYLE
ncbi:hypothetical protein LINPERHAP1_LOCUS34113 [Linum perenne]